MDCPFCSSALSIRASLAGGPVVAGCGKCFNPVLIGTDGAAPLPESQDVRLSAPEGSIAAAVLLVLPKAIQRLPLLPEVSQRVLQMVSDPEVSMQDLSGVIRQDQTIAMAIMKLANSPVYAGLEEIKEINPACARLGMRNIANTVQMVANNNLYATTDIRLKSTMRKLWRHSVATAYCASEIAILTAEPRSEMLFLAGLVQNVGKVVLLDVITGQHSAAMAQMQVSPDTLRQLIDTLSPLLGMHVVQAWNLPPEFVAATYFQNRPGACPRQDWLSMVHIVALAGVVATVEGYGLYPLDAGVLVTNTSAQQLGLTGPKLEALRTDLQIRFAGSLRGGATRNRRSIIPA